MGRTTWSSRLLGAAAGVASVILLVIATGGGTAARWTSQADLPEAVITAGNANLTIDGPTGFTTARLYPGQTVSAAFTVRNTGTTPLALRVDSLIPLTTPTTLAQQDFARALTLRVWPATEPTCGTVPPTSAWTDTTSPTPGDLQVTLTPAGLQQMCLAATLATTAPTSAQGAAITFQLTLGGVQQP